MSHYAGAVPDTLTRPTDWLATAPCKTDPDVMFDTSTAGVEKAKSICRTCPVIDRCLQWALDTGEEHGVWGGLSEQDRRTLKRNAGRPISIDEFTGTHEPRRPVASFEESWDLYAKPDGEHILWTGPKVIYQSQSKTQTTPNRLSFYLDRGHWPEGDTKRMCPAEGCVHPKHLADRAERAANPPAPPTQDDYRALLDKHTEALPGGHVRWTGPAKPFVGGRETTPGKVAFFAGRGRPAVGAVRATCGVSGCVEVSHLSDQEDRGACGTRVGYLLHRRLREPACSACRVANTAANNRLRRTGTTRVTT
ncbi:WhiB family transcriptional regulator [Streptomyces nigra]|uniref:WhiB family transcriptional regulator n=1 Tax=Streptomyces nigra TaxID=1827580 RepID=UPI0037F6687A